MPVHFPRSERKVIDPLREQHRILPFTDKFGNWFCKQAEPRTSEPFGDWRDDDAISIKIATAYPSTEQANKMVAVEMIAFLVIGLLIWWFA